MKLLSFSLSLAVLVLFAACTKKSGDPSSSSSTPTPAAGEISAKSGDPERIILETTLDVDAKAKKTLRKTHLLLWDIKDEKGNIIAAEMAPVPDKFPFTLTVKAKQLLKPVAEKSALVFFARVVKSGEEFKLPQKGQLTAVVGLPGGSEGEIVQSASTAVTDKVLKDFEKKGRLQPLVSVSVGDKVKTSLAPQLF